MKKIAILGNGLLGGSLALAILKNMPKCSVSLWGRNWKGVKWDEKEFFQQSKEKIEETNLSDAIEKSDLLIFAVPVEAMCSLANQILEIGLPSNVLVTDVGSIKGLVHQQVGEIFQERNISFIGSHPMAGSEKSGLFFAQADLFVDKSVILTNDQLINDDIVLSLENFWRNLRVSQVLKLNSQQHDDFIAGLSHLPHLLASLQVLLSKKIPNADKLLGDGFKDLTRIASGNEVMWTKILLNNRVYLLKYIRIFQDLLKECKDSLEKNDEKKMLSFLNEAIEHRKHLLEESH